MTLICTLTQIKTTKKIQQMCQFIKKPANFGGVQKFHEKWENNESVLFSRKIGKMNGIAIASSNNYLKYKYTAQMYVSSQ